MTLIELAERCERAEGPDRELDARIWLVLYRPDYRFPAHVLNRVPSSHQEAVGRHTYDGMGGGSQAPTYTASIDAALTLAEGDVVDVMIEALRRLVEAGKGIDALARFTASAALRSRAATEGQTDG